MRIRRHAALAAVLLLHTGAARADAQAARDSVRADRGIDSVAQKLGAVGVSASRAAGVVGGAVAVIVHPQQLRISPAPLLDQALRESPFVLVRQNARGEMELSVRGSDSRQAAVLLDGLPITLGWDHRTDPSLIPLTGTERIVIVRGLGSLLNGPNTLGGSIEISHDAYAQPTGARFTGGAGIDQYGSFVGTLGYGGRVAEFGGGALSLRAGVAHRQRDGVALPNGAIDPTEKDGLRTGTDFTQVDGFAALRWSAPTGRSLGFTVSAFDAERGVPPEEHIAAPRLWRYPDSRRSMALLSASSGAFQTPLGQGSVEAGVGINDGSFRILTYADRTYTTTNGEELGDERTLTTRALVTHSLGRATLRASYTGADVRYEETLSPAAAVDYRQKLASTGVEVDVPLGAGQLSGGVVFDHTSTPETGGRTPGQEPFDATGWRVGLSHSVGSRVRLHASASERSRFPALRELYSGALNRFRPNPDLQPETLLGFEGGVTIDRAIPRLATSTIQVVGFRHRLDDAVVRITLSNPTRFQRINRDRIESTGAELLAGFAFGNSDPDRAFSVNGDVTLQRIRIFDVTLNDAQRRAENNPEQRGRVELGAPLPARVRGFVTARHTGAQFCLNGDSQNVDRVKAATVSDIAAQRTFTVASSGPFRFLRALVSLDNVANTAVYDQCGLPQPGRTLRAMLTIR